jgi:predicted ATPase
LRALSAALDLTAAGRDALFSSARASARGAAVDELTRVTLPLPLTALLGRDAEMNTLMQWLADPAARLITLVGPGGVGKTRLALELARRIDEEAVTRVVFVPLASVSDSDLVSSAIAEAFGLVEGRAADLPNTVRSACGLRHTLLVLDNCEHVPGATPLIADLLTAVTSLRVLVTSRAPLHLRGERQYSVGPLALHPESGPTSISDRARAPAVRLFVERVRDVQTGFRLTADNGPDVSAICERLDGLPLALELAAPWIKTLTVADLRNRLAHDLLLSTPGPRDLPARQQTMSATVAWSYRLLDHVEMRAFRRFGALPGRFSIGAAAAVLGLPDDLVASDETLNAAASLIDKSLLHRADSAVAGRSLYQMLETVRAYARLELSVSGEQDEAMEGLVNYCQHEVTEASSGLAGMEQSEWLNRIREDLESYREALTWLIERERYTEAGDIAWGLGLFYLVRGQTAEGLHWYERILKSTSLARNSEAKVRVGAGLMYWAQGRLDLARTHSVQALELARDAGATDLAVHAENMLGHIEHAAGNIAAARERYGRSLEGYRALAIPWGIGNALSGMAGVALTAGDASQAERLLDEAAAALRHVGPWFLTPVLCFRAILAVQSGHPDFAMALMRESLTHIRALQDKFAFVYALVPLAAAAVMKENYVVAARILGARDAVAESTGAAIVDSGVHTVRLMAEQHARAVLGSDGWTRAYTAGRACSIDSLLTDLETVES